MGTKFKEGQVVRIKSLKEINDYIEKNGRYFDGIFFDEDMESDCGKRFIIETIRGTRSYYIKNMDGTNYRFVLSDGMIEADGESLPVESLAANDIIISNGIAYIVTECKSLEKGFYLQGPDVIITNISGIGEILDKATSVHRKNERLCSICWMITLLEDMNEGEVSEKSVNLLANAYTYWKLEKKVELTIKEIEEKLGYQVKIVKG